MKKNMLFYNRGVVVLLLLSFLMAMPLAALGQQPPAAQHPVNPGDVMLFKDSELIPGLVNTWQVTLRIEGKDSLKTSDTILVLDTSGSMGSNGRMTAAINAANNLIAALLPPAPDTSPNNRVAVISFAENGNQVIGFTGSRAAAQGAVNGLSAVGGTYTQDGVRLARNLMSTSTADHKNIILLSDGQPTYSARIQQNWRMNTANLTPRTPSGWWTPTTVPMAQFEYGNRVGDGSSIEQRYDNPGGSANDKYYHNGNSAIAEAGFAKGTSTLYTIALQAGTAGTAVLNAMASPGKAYTATPAELDAIFQEIAGEISAAVRDGIVSDPMGTGFEVLGDVSDITVTQGTYTYTYPNITWEVGSPSTPLPNPQNLEELKNIKYAEMTYQVTINDDILGATGVGGEYNTNAGASLTYTDINGVEQTLEFPQPMEDPVLLVLEKALFDSLGNKISTAATGADTRNFRFNVVNYFDYNKDYWMYASDDNHDNRRIMTNLRLEATYTVDEMAVQGEPSSALADYTTTYQISGEAPGTRSFYVDNSGEDHDIVITNKEIPLGELTVTKVFIPQAEGGTGATGPLPDDAPAFPITVVGPTGPDFPNNTHTFTLKHGESKVLTGLPYGQYTVTETDTLGFLVTYTDDDAPPASTMDGKVTLAINSKIHNVTVTNRPSPSDEKTDFTGYKRWVNGPADTHVAVAMDLYADGVLIVPQPGYTVLPAPPATADQFTYTWTELPKYNGSGQLIQYTIKERANIPDYVSTYSQTTLPGDTVTNTYQQGVAPDVTANKVWSNGPLLKPDVYFRLYRTYTPAGGGSPVTEAVPLNEAPIRTLTGGTVGSPTPPTLSTTWEGQTAKAPTGEPYAFSVQEVNQDGSDTSWAPAGYTKSGGTGTAAPLQITNTFVIVTDSVTADKEWSGGDASARPTVWFKLYRSYVDDNHQTVTEAVPLEQAPLKTLPHGTISVTWDNIDQTDSQGRPYTFSVREVDSAGTNLAWQP